MRDVTDFPVLSGSRNAVAGEPVLQRVPYSKASSKHPISSTALNLKKRYVPGETSSAPRMHYCRVQPSSRVHCDAGFLRF